MFEGVLKLLYYFVQFVRHASHPIFSDPGFNFFSIFQIFWDFSKVKKFMILYELNEIVQYDMPRQYYRVTVILELGVPGFHTDKEYEK